MRRLSIFSAGLLLFPASMLLTGCDSGANTAPVVGNTAPPPPVKAAKNGRAANENSTSSTAEPLK